MNIQEVLIRALNKRDVFHSEADFQQHLAWELHIESKQESAIRLKFPLSKNASSRWEYCDIVANYQPKIGIELRYKTKRDNITVGKEFFDLKQQGAQDLGRYDFLKDICRLESWREQGKIDVGYAILLTNDPRYWQEPINHDTADADFRLHDSDISGVLSWGAKASQGTTKGRAAPLNLKSKYTLRWQPTPREDFQFLIVKIGC